MLVKDSTKKVPYATYVGNLMYTMSFTKPDRAIVQVIGIVSRFISNVKIL